MTTINRTHQSKFAQKAELALNNGTLNMEQLKADFLKLKSSQQHDAIMTLRESGDPKLQQLDIELTKTWIQNVELDSPPGKKLDLVRKAQEMLIHGPLDMDQLKADFLTLSSKQQHDTIMALRNSNDPELKKLDIELTKTWIQNVQLPPPPRE